jgi:hypothetical protein
MLPKKLAAILKGFVPDPQEAEDLLDQAAKRHKEDCQRKCLPASAYMKADIAAACEAITRIMDDVRANTVRALKGCDFEPTDTLAEDICLCLSEAIEPVFKRLSSRISSAKLASHLRGGFISQSELQQFDTTYTRSIEKGKAELRLVCAELEKQRKDFTVRTMHVVNNLTGSNPKVNIESDDHSTTITINAKNVSELFNVIRDEVARVVTDETEKEKIVAATSELESAVGGPTFAARYKDWISLAANHVKLVEFAPVLAR